MLMKLINKIHIRLRRIVFFIRYKWRFCKVGADTIVLGPVRIDGGKSICIGKQVTIQQRTWLYSVGIENKISSLEIGNGCAIGYNNHITAVRKVRIGNHVLTANNVYISDNYHEYKDISIPIMYQPIRFNNEIAIGDGTWIGENVCVLGVSVGKNCVIGANAVVTSDIPDYCIAVGVPAKIIRHYSQEKACWLEGPPQNNAEKINVKVKE